MKKEIKIELTELFMAQADKERCFYGIIKRSKDSEGKTLFFSKIDVNQGFVCSQELDRDKLGKNLDEMCIMVVDKKIHEKRGNPRWFCSEIVTNMVRDIFITDRNKSDKIIDDLCKFYMD